MPENKSPPAQHLTTLSIVSIYCAAVPKKNKKTYTRARIHAHIRAHARGVAKIPGTTAQGLQTPDTQLNRCAVDGFASGTNKTNSGTKPINDYGTTKSLCRRIILRESDLPLLIALRARPKSITLHFLTDMIHD